MGVPGADLGSRSVALGGIGVGRDVAHDDPSPARVGQCLVQDHVDLEHGLRLESAASVGAADGQQFRVQCVEVVPAEPTKRYSSDAGHDMELDVAAVAVPRTRPQAGALAWQPCVQEVAPE